MSRIDRVSSSESQREERLDPTQRPPTSPTRQLNEFNARFPYDASHLPPSSATESSRVPPDVLRKPLQRGYSLHSENARNVGQPVDYAVVDSRRAVHSVVDYPSHLDYQQHDRLAAMPRSFSNYTSFSERDKVAADQATSCLLYTSPSPRDS